jgi:hypothetical protein
MGILQQTGYKLARPRPSVPNRLYMDPITGLVQRDTGTEWQSLYPAIPGQVTEWFIDAVNGNDGNEGTSWHAPLLTMAEAFSRLGSGDIINFVGKIREQLITPVQTFDVTIRGCGNRPRHADAAPYPLPGGKQSAATWAMPGSGGVNTTPLLKILQQGWRLENFVMAGPTTAACVLNFRDGGAADAERDASHFEAWGVRFASGQDGIEDSGGCYNVGIFGCSFHDLTGWAIKHTAGAGIAACYRWEIDGNRFQGCAKWIGTFNPHQWRIMHNVVVETTTPGVDMSGGGGHSVIVDNMFDIAAADFDPAGGFTGHANDVWSNTLADVVETGIPAN